MIDPAVMVVIDSDQVSADILEGVATADLDGVVRLLLLVVSLAVLSFN